MATQADYAQLYEKSEERNLKFKTKIIELQNELNNEKNRASEYETKFKDAVLQSNYSSDQQILEKLNHKQNELNETRKQVIELNRRLTNVNNSPSQNDLLALARENEQLMTNIEQIKTAAISAIMMKEQQIDELDKRISRYEVMENELKYQYEKIDSLEREFSLILSEKEEDIRELNEKIARERETFLSKLELFQHEASEEEYFKESLMEKTQNLEGNLEKSQMVISDYEKRIYELENHINNQKISYEQEKTKWQFEVEEFHDNIKLFEKEEKAVAKVVEELRNKEKNMLENVTRLQESNDELSRKLAIKKKKENKTLKDKISSSFSGLAKANPIYASFAFRPKDSVFESKPKHLGDIPEMEELDGMIENFNLNHFAEPSNDSFPQPNTETTEVPISQMMTKKKSQNTDVTESPTFYNSQPASDPSTELTKQIESNKLTILRLQTEKKQLQSNLNGLYNQMSELNESLIKITNELQQQRKNTADLRNQMKKTKKQSELVVEVQSLILHVEKLENDMVSSKLKYAEEADYEREKYAREKVMWTHKLIQLTEKLAKQDLQISSAKESKTEEKKKKKGFFG